VTIPHAGDRAIDFKPDATTQARTDHHIRVAMAATANVKHLETVSELQLLPF
jgi:hypothetical protein